MKTSCRYGPYNHLGRKRYVSVTVVAHKGDPDRPADQIPEALTGRGCPGYPPGGVHGVIPPLGRSGRSPGGLRKRVVMPWLFAAISGLIAREEAHAQ